MGVRNNKLGRERCDTLENYEASLRRPSQCNMNRARARWNVCEDIAGDGQKSTKLQSSRGRPEVQQDPLGGHWGANGAFQKLFKNQCNDVACFAEPVTIPIPPNCWQCTYWCLPSIVTVKRCSRNTTPIRKHRSENSANPNPILAALQGMCALDLQPAKQHMSLYKSPTRKDRKDRQTTQFLCSIFYRWKSLQSQKVSTSGRPHVFRIWKIAMSLNQPTLKLGSTTRFLIKLSSILINHATLRMPGGNGVLSISSWRIMIS